MSPVPTANPSDIRLLSATMTASPPSDLPAAESGSASMDKSTIAAISLGVVLFVTLFCGLGFFLWVRRQRQKRYRNSTGDSESNQSTPNGKSVEKRTRRRMRESILQNYLKRVSLTRSLPSIDIKCIGQPKLIQSSQVVNIPKPAHLRSKKKIRSSTIEIPPITGSSLDLAEKASKSSKSSKASKSNSSTASQASQESEGSKNSSNGSSKQSASSKKRPSPPKLSIPSTATSSSSNAVTSTTIAGLNTNIYVPPTPSKTQFAGAPRVHKTSRSVETTKTKTSNASSQTPQFEYYSPEQIRTPSLSRFRFSDPATPSSASASIRSVRSLSWNGHGHDFRPGNPVAKSSNDGNDSPTPLSTSRRKTHNWPRIDTIRDFSRGSLQTHPQTPLALRPTKPFLQPPMPRALSVSPPDSNKSTNGSSVKPVNSSDTDDQIITDDDSVISLYDCSDESLKTRPGGIFNHTERSSSGQTRRTDSTVFSHDSPPNSRIATYDTTPTPTHKLSRALSRTHRDRHIYSCASPRPLPSSDIEIVTKPGESPPYSPVRFQIDDHPTPPKPSYTPDSQDRIDSDNCEDDTYPMEWKLEMERQAAEDEWHRYHARKRGHVKQSPPSGKGSIAPPLPMKAPRTKRVSFSVDTKHPDEFSPKGIAYSTNEVSRTDSTSTMRVSWYSGVPIATEDEGMRMF
ncbi:hypothetical protein Dda_2190 [Drechslerella dactyloides]|uniref:Uncharacterized protein n=1 Tax=Drechslerella dactyloides TaxID=74499 RepID=A0AAD6J763_DREDA|nr:hypothetical protein Dda_2190 [Drechslerella dactyloides]